MRRRILFAIVSVTTVAVVLFAVPLAFTLSDLYHEEAVIRLERAAAELSENVPTAFPRVTDPVEFPATDGRLVALYDRAGDRIAGRGPIVGDGIVKRALRGDVTDTQNGEVLVVGTPVTRGERVVGALRVEATASAISSRTWNSVLVMAGFGALVVTISAAIATWQARRLARPVDRLARDAVRLGEGDFTIDPHTSGVPELDSLSHALTTTAARLDEMLIRERRFSEDASHQLRTPLAGLRVTLEAAQIDAATEPSAAFDAALAQVDRLESTIEDLLVLAREQPAARSDVDLRPILTALDDDWHGRLAVAGRPLRVISDRDVSHAAVSDRALRQILDVLVDNALQHGSGEISVHARGTPGGVVIDVTDEGPGITGDPDSIFQRRAPGATNNGIGLALARSLAEAEGLRLNLVHPGPEPVFSVFVPTRV